MTEDLLTYDSGMTVGWGDCDAAGISYYAKNFDWYTDARFQFLAHHGLPYMETFHDNGISLVCLKAESDYKKMLRPFDQITVRTSLTELTRARMAFHYQIIKEDGEGAAEGFTTHAYVSQQGKPLNLKKAAPELWKRLSKIVLDI